MASGYRHDRCPACRPADRDPATGTGPRTGQEWYPERESPRHHSPLDCSCVGPNRAPDAHGILCYYAASLPAAQFTHVTWRTQWILVVHTMVDAYGKVVNLIPAEVKAVWIAMIAIEALFVGLSAQRDPKGAERTVAISRWLFEQRHRWPG